MDLKAKLKTLVGQRIGVEGTVYDQWEGDVLKGISDAHAKQLMEAPDFWTPVRRAPVTPQAPAPATPPPPPAPEPTPEPEAESELSEASDDETEDEEDGYSEADLMAMPKAELLEFLDETQQEEAAKLKKTELVKLIMEGTD